MQKSKMWLNMITLAEQGFALISEHTNATEISQIQR